MGVICGVEKKKKKKRVCESWIFGDVKLGKRKKRINAGGGFNRANGRGDDCARWQALAPRYTDFIGVADGAPRISSGEKILKPM